MSPPPRPPPGTPLLGPDGLPAVERLGVESRRLDDVYHFFVRSPWRVVLGLITGIYLALNLLFACAYLLVGGVENARPGSFADAFFFSVQTIATVGYGRMAPVTLTAHLIVLVETLVGLLSIAMMTGLIFAKFSRPTARVMFSRVAVVTDLDGRRALLFRVANTRTSQIVEASLRVILLRKEVTAEGHLLRRMSELKLQRSDSPFFALSWLAIHLIDESSPLHGLGPESLRRGDALLVASLTGTEEIFAQTVHARHAWHPDDLRWDARFVDIFHERPDGGLRLDLRRFHDVEPAESPAVVQESVSV